jgi:hypothetical protein
VLSRMRCPWKRKSIVQTLLPCSETLTCYFLPACFLPFVVVFDFAFAFSSRVAR